MLVKVHHATLSQAIREGAKLRPQATDRLAHSGRTCTLGVALEAMGAIDGAADVCGFDAELDGNLAYRDFITLYPYISTTEAPCPACGIKQSLYSTIIKLNDQHKWTREAIADWLEEREEELITIFIFLLGVGVFGLPGISR